MSKYTVNSNNLNIRKEPNLTGPIMGVLHKGEIVDVGGVSPDHYWLNVKTNDGKLGWCAGKYLTNNQNDNDILTDELPWMPIAIKEIGVKEFAGTADNPRIVEYLRSTSLGAPENKNDETAWCSSFVNWCVEKSGNAGTDSALARSWLHWGKEISDPVRGCITIFKRPCDSSDSLKRCGHVAFFISETNTEVTVLGGNQHDQVCYSKYSKLDIMGYRVAE